MLAPLLATSCSLWPAMENCLSWSQLESVVTPSSLLGSVSDDKSLPLPPLPRSPVFSSLSLVRKGSRHSQSRTGTPARRRRTGPPPQRKGSPGLWPQQPPPPGVTAPAESCPAQTSQFPDCGDRSAGERTDGLRSDTGTRRRVQMQIGPSSPASGPRVPRGSRRRARVAPRGGSEARGAGGTQAPRWIAECIVEISHWQTS